MDLILTILQTTLAFIVVLSILVFVHEYGHYIGCRICGVRVDSFSIGMGKELWGWTDKRGVRWKVSMLPFGGYLKMYGDEDVASGKADKKVVQKMTKEERANFENPYKKFVVIFFGPMFNLIFAVLLLTAIVRVNGITDFKPIIDSVVVDSPSAAAGLEKGDIIVSMNGRKIKNFSEVINTVAINNMKPICIELLRGNNIIVKEIQPRLIKTKDMFGNEIEAPSIGVVSLPAETKKVGIFRAFIEANKNVYKMCKDTLVVIGQMITGNRNADGLGGPLKIAQYSAQSFQGGFIMVIYFMALISANLGLMNLLPIPILDGGHLIFLLIEIIFRRPIPEKIQEKLLQGGFAILIGIMIFATFNDVRGFIR